MVEQNVWFCVSRTNLGTDVNAASTRELALKLGVEGVKLHWDEVKDARVREILRYHLARGAFERVIETWNAATREHYIDVYGPGALVNEDFNVGNFPEEPKL